MDAYILNDRSTSASLAKSTTNTLGSETPRPEFYYCNPELDRTLRMDMGGLCHLCGRKSARRVEMHTPLWKAGPIMYGECCLRRAETSLLTESPRAHAAKQTFGEQPSDMSWKLWLTFATTAGIAVLAIGLELLLHVGMNPF